MLYRQEITPSHVIMFHGWQDADIVTNRQKRIRLAFSKHYLERRRSHVQQGQFCTIDGVRYHSEYAAAKVLGVDTGVLRLRLRSPGFPEYTSEYRQRSM